MASRLRGALGLVGVAPAHRPPSVHLKTSSLGFAAWWVVLLGLHVVNLGYYAGAAYLYRAMHLTNVDFQLTTYSIGINPTQWYKVSTIHWIIAAVHIIFMLAMVVGSLQHRRLVFQPSMPQCLVRVWARKIARKKSVSTDQNSVRSSLPKRMSSVTEYTAELSDSVFGREGLLGVDGVYFDHLHLARELVETTLQAIQVYRMSYLLPHVWLIRFYVLLLIANCWSTPIVHRVYSSRHVQRRMMSLLCDAVLDMMSSIGVSLWIFATYLPQHTDPAFGFPFENWFDDVWFTNMQQEFQMMIVVSWADLGSRLVFAIGLLQCMESIKQLLTPTDVAIGSNQTNITAVKPGPTSVTGVDEQLKAMGPSNNHVQELPTPTIINVSGRTRLVKFALEKVGPGFFVLAGFVILIVHIVSETRVTASGVPCRLVLHPWFVNKPACSLLELDCHHLGDVSGSEESMREVWNAFEFGATARILVRHCPQLEIPPTIAQYHQLTAFKLYNCSLNEWSVAAAFTEVSHTNMRALFVVRSNFPNGVLPPGLLTTQYPSGLKSFVSIATNLMALPDYLHEVWPPGMTLAFELSQLSTVPATILKMNAVLLSFAGTSIASVPPQLFESPVLECVLLTYTNIQELPRVVTNPSPAMYLMFLEGTNVSTFWSWMEPFVQFSFIFNSGFFNAHGSRYCAERAEIVAGNRTGFSKSDLDINTTDLASVMDVSTPAKLEFAVSAVVCEPGFPFYFPLALQDATTALATDH